MTNTTTPPYQSKLFAVGSIQQGLNYAVRGEPRTSQPADSQPIDVDKAWAWFAPEIALLDPLNPKLRLFQAGPLGAALISLTIEPATIEFWDAFNDERWTRQADGRLDAPGYLLQELYRHSGNRGIAVRPEQQYYLLQTALATTAYWWTERSQGREAWLTTPPPRVQIPELLAQVRSKKGLRQTQDGFRPKGVLAGRVPRLVRSEIEHTGDLDMAMAIARQAATVGEYAADPTDLEKAREQLEKMDIPNELAAPGALAAAIVTMARNPDDRAIWENAFAGRWIHESQGRSDTSGLIVGAIRYHNRAEHGLDDELALFARCTMAIKSHHRLTRPQADPSRKNLARLSGKLHQQLLKACDGLTLPRCPTIAVGVIDTTPRPSGGRKACSPRGRGRTRTGKRGERCFAQMHAKCAWPRSGELTDRTDDQCGFDFELAPEDDEPEWALEVKTVKDGEEIVMGDPQWQQAEKLGDRYWLIIVHRTKDGKVRYQAIRNPAALLKPRIVPVVIQQITHRISSRDWVAAITDELEFLPEDVSEGD